MNEPDYITEQSNWSFDLIKAFDNEISNIATDFQLDTYPNQIELISSEQMMDAYSSVGMPVGYHHWSFGKQFLNTQQGYERGRMGLAYEIVINSDPCIAYLMEENSMMMQALVIAHACYGHNSFFKGNYLFRTWTDASAIIDYLVFAKNYIAQCEQLYGVEEVEKIIDSCHALQNYGVDRYKRPKPMSTADELHMQKQREKHMQMQVNLLWKTIPATAQQEGAQSQHHFPTEPQENLLYFIEKHAPLLEIWQREIIRIVRKMAQYFYPQRQTQVMNEGWATFWHYTIMNELYDRRKINEGFIIEFLMSHTAVIRQPDFDEPYYSGINPYALGFAMFSDIKRMCLSPTLEDKQWFPQIAGSDWLQTLHFAMRNFKDESFIQQFLSPKVIRDLKLFCIFDDEKNKFYQVEAIHDEHGYRLVREQLAQHYNLSMREPNIQVYNVDLRGDRSLTLRHIRHNNMPLNKDVNEVLKHLHRLWGFDIHLHSYDDDELKCSYRCPETALSEQEEQLKYV